MGTCARSRASSWVALAIAAASLAAPVAGQTLRAAAKTKAATSWSAPRTPWGHPDLQGIWDFATITPMERPSELSGKESFTDEEAAAFEKRTLERRNQDRRDGGAQADVSRAYNHFWWDFGTRVIGTKRTSLVVDPPDGRIPPVAPEATQEGGGPRRGSGPHAVRPRRSKLVGTLHPGRQCRAADGSRRLQQ